MTFGIVSGRIQLSFAPHFGDGILKTPRGLVLP
jgi:hypothetical protein